MTFERIGEKKASANVVFFIYTRTRSLARAPQDSESSGFATSPPVVSFRSRGGGQRHGRGVRFPPLQPVRFKVGRKQDGFWASLDLSDLLVLKEE